MSLLQELKRRNVFKVAIAYVVVAWLVLQIADVILNNIEAPGWVFQALMLMLGIGFPFAMIFAWAFELTPEGLKRDHEVDRSQSITHVTSRKLDFIIIGLLAIGLGYFAWESRFAGDQTSPAPAASAPPPSPVAELVHSIAVLPFINMSSDAEQEYFSDGLSEELLNLLAKIPELKVASRSSAFQYKGEKFDLAEVAKKLNVAYVLEGSVRKAGNQVRITAQLIKADDGFHLWSETYDRSLENIFAIQDEISSAVVDALKLELLGAAPKAQVVNPEAYALYLKGRYLHSKWGKDNFAAAVDAYQQALAIEPDYAEALAALAVTYMNQVQSGYLASDEGLEMAATAVNRALEINPDQADAWARLSLMQGIFEWDWPAQERSAYKALALAPNDLAVIGAVAQYTNTQGMLDETLAHYDHMLQIEPLGMVPLYNRADTLHRMGRLQEAETAFRYLLELNPEDWGSHTQLAIIMLEQGRAEEAWNELDLEVDPDQAEWGRILVLPALGRDAEAETRLAAFIEQNQTWAAYLVAGVYAWQGRADEAFTWLNRAYEQREGWLTQVKNDPLMVTLHEDPRWVALLDKLKLPH